MKKVLEMSWNSVFPFPYEPCIKCHKEKRWYSFSLDQQDRGIYQPGICICTGSTRFFVITFKFFFPNEFAIRQQIDSNVKESEHLI